MTHHEAGWLAYEGIHFGSLGSSPAGAGRGVLTLTWKPAPSSTKGRPGVTGGRSNPCKTTATLACALFGDLFDHPPIILAVDFRVSGETSLKDQLDDGLAGRPIHRHEVAW